MKLLSRRACRLALMSGTLLNLGGSAAAQANGSPISVSGRIMRHTVSGDTPVTGEMVTLHRLGTASAGPVDSMLTDRAGRYAFRFRADSASIYLASARYGGIAYFAAPVRAGEAESVGEISVFDTTSREVPIGLHGRHLVVSAPNANGLRTIVDVMEIGNDTIVTRVAGAANRPTFTVVLPEGVRDARVSQGDISGEAVTVSGNRANVFAPLSPGLRQLVLTYDVPVANFPLLVTLDRAAGLLEVLLEETAGSAQGAGLASVGNVAVEGRNFSRWTARDPAAGSVVTLALPSGGMGASWSAPPWLLSALLGLLTLGGVIAFSRRGATPAADAPARTPGEALALARAAAAIDALVSSDAARAPGEREGLMSYREALKERLATVLAREGGAR